MAIAAVESVTSTTGGFVARGDKIEVMRMGVARAGRVEFVSALQVLVKWDDGRSTGLRLDRGDRFRVVH